MASPEPAKSPFRFRPLTGRERMLLIVTFLILYGVAFYFWVYQPFTAQIADLRAKYNEERAKLMSAQAIFHRLSEINAKITELNEKLAEFDLLVPGDNRAAHFLYACGQWERTTGARVRRMTFEAPKDTGGYQEYTVQFRVVGTYAAQVKFLAELEGMSRLVRVDSVALFPEDLDAGAASGEAGTSGTGPASEFATTDVVTADYTVHLFVDPGKAAQAAEETPGEGLTFTLPEGRGTPFLP